VNSKLSSAQIAALRHRYAEGDITHTELARIYGIHRGQVSRIVNGKSRASEPTVPGVFERILNGLR